MARVFVVENRRYPDPDPGLTVDQVRQQYTSFFPELATATATERREGEDTIVEFIKRVGTKGSQETLIFQIVSLDEGERINCHGCAQDRDRVLVAAETAAGALGQFMTGEGMCSACWVERHSGQTIKAGRDAIGAYERN